MKNKNLYLLLSIILTIILSLFIVACSNDKNTNNNVNNSSTNEPSSQLQEFTGLSFSNQEFDYDAQVHSLQVEGAPDGANIEYNKKPTADPGRYEIEATISKEGYTTKTMTATMEIKNPTSQQVENARQSAINSDVIGYDFILNLGGSISIAGFSGQANAHYEGKYRLNTSTNSMQFMRETSGLLLYDSIEYIENKGSNKIKVKINPDSKEVKSVSVLPDENIELNLINLPFTELIDRLVANDIKNIQFDAENENYKFSAQLQLSANNPILNTILKLTKLLGTNISIKDVSFTNPASGIVLYFNLDESMKLQDFKYSLNMSFPIKGINTSFTIDYEQHANVSNISIPNYSSFVTDENEINDILTTINNSIEDIANDDAYSLDVVANNEFDPGWNVSATKDKYTARMFKNTYDLDGNSFVAFNHSYTYKTHHEEDGKESYDYTIGNISSDNSTWLISRKGKNTQTALPTTTIDTQFNYLTNPFMISSNKVDCIKINTKNNTITYEIYLNKEETLNVQQKIINMINSNDAEGVIKVDNYMNSQCDIKDAYMMVVIKDGKLASIEMVTKIKYAPTDGEHTEKNITLDNKLSLLINDNLSKAIKYTAPKNVETSGLKYGLNNYTFFIL